MTATILIIGGIVLGVAAIAALIIRRRNRIAQGLPVIGDGHWWRNMGKQ